MLQQVNGMIRRFLGARWRVRAWWRWRIVRPTSKVIFRLKGETRYGHFFHGTSLAKAFEGCPAKSDISDHLGSIFFFAAMVRPKLIVELGTRGGESTRFLLAAAAVNGSTVLSIDLQECPALACPCGERWKFVRADDVEFGNSGFEDWCREQHVEAAVDVLFVDTSHEYAHTQKEIEAWTRHLSKNGLMIFHDSNMGHGLYAHTDGSVSYGWDNRRGVIRAIEEFLGRQYDERSFFYDRTEKFLVMHFPYCSGLTVLQRVDGN